MDLDVLECGSAKTPSFSRREGTRKSSLIGSSQRLAASPSGRSAGASS